MSKTLDKQALLEHIDREIAMAEHIKSALMTKRMKYQHVGIIRALKELQKEINSGFFDVRDHQLF